MAADATPGDFGILLSPYKAQSLFISLRGLHMTMTWGGWSVPAQVAMAGVVAGLVVVPAAQQAPPPAATATLGAIEMLVGEAIAAKLLPGAVVLVGLDDAVLYEQAFGQRAVAPAPEAMTVDTVFDLASLTKVVATTSAVMHLVERGRLRLNDPVASWIPGFERHGKAGITVRHLLTHVSGLRPDVDLAEVWEGYETAIELARAEVPVAAPGERFIYSDINFFVLGAIVAQVSGVPLDEYARREIFAPLEMADTGFNPSRSLSRRIAPTERCERLTGGWPCNAPSAAPLRGVVHDPTARRMGGVAGHAGLFGTARDLARFARMLLGGGRLGNARILSPLTVARMTSPATPAGLASTRGLGWDIDTSYSANRGDLLPIGSFGHTGFTGTSIWIDPRTRLFVIFLSSRLHPDGKGDVTALRGKVATVAASAVDALEGSAAPSSLRMSGTDFGASADPLRPRAPAPSTPVATGLDVLAQTAFEVLRGRRVGLVTNHTGRSRSGESTIDLLHAARDVQLVSLFSPEHGIRGVLDTDISFSRDEKTGLPIHSLYGDTRRPSEAMLQGIDTLVIDLQDVGTRFYTYMTTTAYLMEEAATRNIRVVVLDRPNPIDGWHIEGPAADEAALGFNAYLAAMPVRHGMTLGEIARIFNAERAIGADLVVVPAEHWRRDFWFDQTGLAWVNPSPNMRNLHQATLYPGIGAIEWSNISVGRGTDQPFEQVGAPWVDGPRLAATLNARSLPGIRVYPVQFTPSSSKYAGEACHGVFLMITDRSIVQPVRLGLEVAAALWKVHGDRYRMENTDRLLGSRASLERVQAGEDPASVAESWAAAEARWRTLRAKYLLYR
ncbi:MAG: exo-beta-N-acetylmuramidase NamZ domain-containing protein [Vicinamibacterales bacterium]